MPARIAHTFCVLVVGSSAAFGGDCLPDLDGSGDVATPDLLNVLAQCCKASTMSSAERRARNRRA